MELFLGLRIHDSGDLKGYFPGLQAGPGSQLLLSAALLSAAAWSPGPRMHGQAGAGTQRRQPRLVSALSCLLGPRYPQSLPQPPRLHTQVAYRDTAQAQLGGMEPFETAPLPPAHSRHASTSVSPGPLGPLGAGAADAAAAAAGLATGAGTAARLQLLAEEDLEAGGAPDSAVPDEEDEDRAHAVPGVPAGEPGSGSKGPVLPLPAPQSRALTTNSLEL